MGNADDTDDLAVVRPLAVQPSTASREMMRSLADRLSISLRMQSGLLEAAIGEIVAALYAGRFEVYLHAHERVRLAHEAIRAALAGVKKTHEAIDDLDPSYGAALSEVQEDIIYRSVARKARTMDLVPLAAAYIQHLITCPGTCGERRAYEAEFKRRNLDAPTIDGILGSRR